ncbi:MAG: glycoside hydrolase family 1 protein [Bdellovibrionaceae bacterium]|nr:glycoside hydrolase family 1 protein [Pseudobdellovibrionaceae bacterium]
MRAWIVSFAIFLISQLSFSEAFWWGVSTSPYQTEDIAISKDDTHFFKTDWDLFYEAGRLKYPKNDAVFSFTEYKRDIQKMKELGLTHYRFGIEWARIEPKIGSYNKEALLHYKKIAMELKKNNITPIICLWHWTFPSWAFDVKDPKTFGWMNENVKQRWPDFVKLVIEEFKDVTIYYAPQNEPNAQSLAGFFMGIFPPGEKYSLKLYRQHIEDAADAFIVAADLIKKSYPQAQVMSVQNMIYWEKAWWDITNFFYNLGDEFNYRHLERIKDHIDIVGFNYYYRVKASPFPNERVIDPEGLKLLLLKLAERYKKPLLITENGWADPIGKIKTDYLLKHIEVVKEYRHKTGLLGYFYWSLIDNYEWAAGYEEKFGLFHFNPGDKSLQPYEVVDALKKIVFEDKL